MAGVWLAIEPQGSEVVFQVCHGIARADVQLALYMLAQMVMSAAFLFDVDGTLIDSVDLHAKAWQEALAHFGFHVPYERGTRPDWEGR